jgi:hypothetical protein
MQITRFDIHAWQVARELCNTVYHLTKNEKFSRDFGLSIRLDELLYR